MEPTITTTTTITGNTITNSVVGADMENITHVIQQLPPELAQLRTALEELHQNPKPVLIELTKTQSEEAEKAAKRLDQFVEAAKEKKPDKDFLQVTSKGLLDAAKTVAAMADPIIATVDKLRPLIVFELYRRRSLVDFE